MIPLGKLLAQLQVLQFGKGLAVSSRSKPNKSKDTNMNKLKYITVILIAVGGLGLQQAQAHLLDPVQFTTNSPIGSGTDENTFLQGQNLLPGTSQFLGKFEDNGFENGAINISQFVTINQVSGNTWEITWNLTGSGFTLDGVLIKDGRIQGAGVLYRFYGVSADEALIGSGTVTFDNPIRDISHISFFGSPGGQVPDGGATVMLLGAGLSALGMVRRYLKS